MWDNNQPGARNGRNLGGTRLKKVSDYHHIDLCMPTRARLVSLSCHVFADGPSLLNVKQQQLTNFREFVPKP
jgi:hypothetical protein